MKNISIKTFGYFFIAIGLIFIVGAALTYWNLSSYLNNAKPAIGEVVKMNSDSYDYTISAYSPVIDFTTDTGKKIEFDTYDTTNPPLYNVGQDVPVIYDPENPSHAQMKEGFTNWSNVWTFGFIGGFFVIMGLLIMNFMYIIMFIFIRKYKSQL